MLTVNGMMTCPRCQGSTWDPVTGKDCHVCGATGAMTDKGERVSYEEASSFIQWAQENKPRRILK